MELYDGIRNALRRRGCPWIEEHVFEFMGQKLRFDIHDIGQNYILKIVHHAAEGKKADKSEPYIRKDFSLKSCEALADGFLFWLESLCLTPAAVKEVVPVRQEKQTPRSR